MTKCVASLFGELCSLGCTVGHYQASVLLLLAQSLQWPHLALTRTREEHHVWHHLHCMLVVPTD